MKLASFSSLIVCSFGSIPVVSRDNKGYLSHTVKNGVNSIHSWGVPQTGLKLPPRVYSKGVYVPSRV